jgi:hypothetical protein
VKGEVEVTFKCEGCGKVLCVSKHNQPSDVWQNVGQTMSIGDFTCPNCAAPTYGPLTVEIVAEALYDAGNDDPSYPWSSAKQHIVGEREQVEAQARFVLRLLKDVESAGGTPGLLNDPLVPHHKGWTASEWREHIIDLARRP